MKHGWTIALALTLALATRAQLVQAHAEHGTGEPVPQVSQRAKLPRGVDITVIKTTAHQFGLSSDGKQTIEVLSETDEPFIRIEKQEVLANINSAYWYRSLQPGGGPVPARLKTGEQFAKLPADWKPVAQQAGFGWYDMRLVDETLASFHLTLRINGTKHRVLIERKPLASFKGYWNSRLTHEPDASGLSALIPGQTTGAISLSRMPSDKSTHEVLDTSAKPFIRSTPEGWWVNINHPWFKDTGLFVNQQNPQTRSDWASEWVKASGSMMLTYQDPRLKSPSGASKTTRTWSIPVRDVSTMRIHVFAGDIQWRSVDTSGRAGTEITPAR